MTHRDRRYSLRLQLTTSCQLVCGYCRPDRVGARSPRALDAVDLTRIAGLLTRIGVDRIRITGGEPLLDDAAVWVVGRLAGLAALRELTLTTNGQLLAARAATLRGAGLDRVNVHIDSLDAERYQAICGGRLDRALAGLRAAVGARLRPKVNVVVQRGVNDHEIPSFCRLGRELGVVVRFIEIMDTGIAPELAASQFVSGAEIGLRLEGLGATRVPRESSAPAVEYRFADGTRAGVIASETQPFCDSCDRLRLGSDGVLRTCLYAASGLDTAALLRVRMSDDDLVERMAEHVAAKRSEHPGAPSPVRLGRGFSMAAIGG